MPPIIVTSKASPEDIKKANEVLGTMTKVVVDVKKGILAMGCDFHSVCAEQLIAQGSSENQLWGARIQQGGEIDFISHINIREDNNNALEIQNKNIRAEIESIIKKLNLI